MSENKLPQSVDVPSLANAGARLSGQTPLARFSRLWDLTPEGAASLVEGLGPVRWEAQFRVQQVAGATGQAVLHLQVDAQLPLQCQRCLLPYAQAVQVDREFGFVKDEATAEALDDESELDLLVASRQFDLAGLIEDEVLMAMPIVPRHEQCPVPVITQAGEVGPEPDKPNPFAALAALKGGGNGDGEGGQTHH